MAGLFDNLGQSLYENFIGRDETRIDEFTMLNAWKFFIDLCIENPKVYLCVLGIERAGNHYVIRQLMFDKNSQPIMVKGDYVLGRKIQAFTLSDDVLEFMNGHSRQYLYLNTLLGKDK